MIRIEIFDLFPLSYMSKLQNLIRIQYTTLTRNQKYNHRDHQRFGHGPRLRRQSKSTTNKSREFDSLTL